MRTVDFHIAIGPHNHQPRTTQVASDMEQQVESPSVGIVQVLERHQERLLEGDYPQ
jgi:hypothetical protein